jgi:hypothetical protein
MTGDDAAQVLVDNHGGRVERVEEDGVGGFGTDAQKGEQLLADGVGIGEGSAAECVHLAGVVRVEESDEGFEGGGFAQHETGGPDEIAEIGFGDGAQAVNGENAACFKVGDGSLDRFSGGVLGEVGADDDFEGGFGGPPLLGTETLEEMLVHRTQAAGGWVGMAATGLRLPRCRTPGFLRWHRFNLRIDSSTNL